MHCCRCLHDWTQRLRKKPKICPRCKSPKWNVERAEKISCKFCKHVWEPRLGRPPVNCPNCARYDYMDPNPEGQPVGSQPQISTGA